MLGIVDFFCFKQKTAYEMRISDWSSDVCSSDLFVREGRRACGVVGASLGIDAELERQHHLEWRRAGAHHISEGVVQGDPGEAAPVARAPVDTEIGRAHV